MNSVTSHVARPTHLEIFWPHLGNQGAVLPGHGRALLWALGPGGPSTGHMACSIPGEAEALPPYKGMYHATAQSDKALLGATQGLSPLSEGELYERRLSSLLGDRKLTREQCFP
jgi:hypothetical protein